MAPASRDQLPEREEAELATWAVTQTELRGEHDDVAAMSSAECLSVTATSVATPSRSLSPKLLEVGEKIGRYVILGTLGVGGMEVVHAAYDPELDRKLAIKLLRGADTRGRRRLEVHTRLLREAQAIAKLNHPNVVAVHDVGLHSGQVFVAMEFVDGGTLGDWMKPESGPRPWPEVLATFRLAGEGLAAAHAAGLVHRDFKPANVLLGCDGRPRVADFGIARSVEGGDTHELEVLSLVEGAGSELEDMLETSGALTRTGVLVGTPAYMAPEQFRDAQVDARADQFAFCVALYEALYGERPFAGDTLHALIHSITQGEIREPPRGAGVPGWLRKILLRGLQKQPQARWPDMRALLTALRRRPRRFGRLAATGCVVLAVLAGSFAIARDDPGAAPTPMCAEAQARLGETWSPETRAAVAARLDTLPAARGRRAPFLARLDAWAADWQTGWVDACEATHLLGEQSAELLDLRMGCLARERRRVDAYLDLLLGEQRGARGEGRGAPGQLDAGQLDAALLDGLDAVVEELGDPQRCADTQVLLASIAVPSDPGQRARVDELSARLDPVYAALATGNWALAASELSPLGQAIAAEGWRPLAAELAYLRGELGAGTSSLEQAEAGYRAAFLDALEVGDERLAAKARRDLALLIAEWDARHDEALAHLRVARALARHLGDAELEGSVALAQATTLELRGDFEAALEAVHRGAALMAKTHAASSTILADARYRESMTLYRLGRLEQAREALAAAKAGLGDSLGDTHPLTLALLNAQGVLELGAADWSAATASFAELLRRKQALFGADHLDVSDALSNLGGAQYQAGELEAARSSHARALEIREAQMGADNLYVGHSLANLAVVDARLERHGEAEAAARRALVIIANIRGDEHHDTMVAHSLIAEVLQLAGDLDGARVEFRRAQRMAQALGLELSQVEISVQLASVLVGLGRYEVAAAELDVIEGLRRSAQVSPAQNMLYDYLRARIAVARDDSQLAAEHVALARAQLEQARSSAVGTLDEAEAWLATQP